MKHLNLQETTDFLETATIINSVDHGHAVVHVGTNAAGAGFVLVNDHTGQSMLTETI